MLLLTSGFCLTHLPFQTLNIHTLHVCKHAWCTRALCFPDSSCMTSFPYTCRTETQTLSHCGSLCHLLSASHTADRKWINPRLGMLVWWGSIKEQCADRKCTVNKGSEVRTQQPPTNGLPLDQVLLSSLSRVSSHPPSVRI